MVCPGDNATDSENTFRFAFPKKGAVELWFGDERGRLITHVDKLRRNHRYRKADRDGVALGDFSARWLHGDAAGVRFGVRLFLFRIFIGIGSRQGNTLIKCKTASDEQQGCS